MTSDEILERIDRRLERGDELMARNTAAFERLMERLGRDEKDREHREREHEEREREHREFIRSQSALLADIGRQMNLGFDRALRRYEAAMDKMQADIKANTAATWAMLDRFGLGPGDAPA